MLANIGDSLVWDLIWFWFMNTPFCNNVPDSLVHSPTHSMHMYFSPDNTCSKPRAPQPPYLYWNAVKPRALATLDKQPSTELHLQATGRVLSCNDASHLLI